MKKMFLLLAIGAVVSSTLISCSKDKENAVAPVVDNSTMVTYKDVTFSLVNDESADAGRFFSTQTGKSYKRAAIDGATAPKIDIAFSNMDHTVNFFISPKNTVYISPAIVGATETIFINHVTNQLTAAEFDGMTDDSKLKTLTIDANDDNSFGRSTFPVIILFKNAAGKKGAIKVKSIHEVGMDPRIVVDIKVQK
jgi:hypothetical protein